MVPFAITILFLVLDIVVVVYSQILLLAAPLPFGLVLISESKGTAKNIRKSPI